MSFGNRLVHTLVIQRATSGAVDDYNQPSRTYAVLATVQGLVDPKSVEEMVQQNQAGAVVSDYTIHLYPTDLTEADYFQDSQNRVFEIKGIKVYDFGESHLEVDALLVAA